MDVESVIKTFGSQAEVVRALGLKSHATLWYWRRNGIPYPRQCQIEVASKGKLKAQQPA